MYRTILIQIFFYWIRSNSADPLIQWSNDLYQMPTPGENSLTEENKLALNTVIGLTEDVEDENVIGF